MRSVIAASAVRGSRLLVLGGLVTVLIVGGTGQAGAATSARIAPVATLADSMDASGSYTGIGGLVGVVAVGLGVLGLVLGILRRRNRGPETCAANARVDEHTTISAHDPAEGAGGWATEPLAVPTRVVPVRAHRAAPARPAPRMPAGQRLTTR